MSQPNNLVLHPSLGIVSCESLKEPALAEVVIVGRRDRQLPGSHYLGLG